MQTLRTLLLLPILLFSLPILAQQTNYDVIIQPVDTKARDFSEYLVQLAWLNRPESSIAQTEADNKRDLARNTKKEWMRDVQASFNLNETNLRSPDTLGNVFFPRYNFGVTLNLYNILSQKDKNDIARRDIQIAESRINSQKLEIRAETLTRLAQYRLAKEILKTRALVEQELRSSFVLIEQLYKTDEKTFDEYSTASGAYFQAQEGRIRAETDLMLAKIKLEEIIGLRWEQVQHPNKDE